MMKDSTLKQCKDWMSVKETILLVEDEDTIRFMARMFLKTNGYNVIEAGSGSEAVAIWETNKSKIDLVVTDLFMPGGIMGLQLAQRLQIDRPNLKVIFTSGHDCEENAFLDSATNFLPKPYRLNSLAEIVRQSLDTDVQAA